MTQTAKGTPMGELLRRYWHPIAAAGEFDDQPTKQVRLLGEDLVLYKDRSGTYGLLALHCAHRRADLSYGFVEDCGLRCSYHGWAYDEKGACISAPFEDVASGNSRFRDQIRQPAYPVQEMAGLLFAYLGPEPAPLLPKWEAFSWENGFAQIVIAPLDCNWLQAAENNVDPVHFEWLHNNWSSVQASSDGSYSPAPRHMKIEIDEWEYGFGYKRILEGSPDRDVTYAMPRMAIMPNLFIPGGTHFEYRVPIDDTHTLSVVWAWQAVPEDRLPYVQGRIPHWFAKITDPITGRWVSTHVINQDTIAWIGQGIITDRENEHLGRSDIGVVKYRNQLKADMEAVQRGEDPTGVIRDPAKNVCIRWMGDPDRTERLTHAPSREQFMAQLSRGSALREPGDYFQFYAGQPPSVRRAFEEAMGLDPVGLDPAGLDPAGLDGPVTPRRGDGAATTVRSS
jgi:5,5'-dehydrodivanillate O-demethylase oxygenase subunit